MRQLTGGWESKKEPPEGVALECVTEHGKKDLVYYSKQAGRAVPIYTIRGAHAFYPPENVKKWRLKVKSIEENK